MSKPIQLHTFYHYFSSLFFNFTTEHNAGIVSLPLLFPAQCFCPFTIYFVHHSGDRILQACSRKWELGRHGAHVCVHTCGGAVIPACLRILLHICICGHKEYSVFISHRLGEDSHGCARYKAIVDHLQVAYIAHGLLFAEVGFLIWRKNKLK